MRRTDEFLQIARGSATELEYHILLARDVHLLSETAFRDLDSKVVEVERMLTGLVKRVQPALLEKRVSTVRSQRTQIASS